jgi:FAD/FMN-containing dehydrogenase
MSDRDPAPALFERLLEALGPRGVTRDPEAMAAWSTDWRGRVTGRAAALLSPATTAEVAAIVRIAADERVPIVPQGGNSSMVAGATPDASGTRCCCRCAA